MFRDAYGRRRCIMPVDPFFEWKAIKGEKVKQPYAIGMKDGKPLITDNGCMILDLVGLQIAKPAELEAQINNIPGVVTVGLFAQRGADVALLGTEDGVKKLTF